MDGAGARFPLQLVEPGPEAYTEHSAALALMEKRPLRKNIEQRMDPSPRGFSWGSRAIPRKKVG